MSSQRGNIAKSGPPKYKNKVAFKHNKNSKITRRILQVQTNIEGELCKHCADIIEWKKKYRKYKPLTAPRKCQRCDQKTVKWAYHLLCTPCAREQQVCAKCTKPHEHTAPANRDLPSQPSDTMSETTPTAADDTDSEDDRDEAEDEKTPQEP